MGEFRFAVRSALNATADEVWTHAASMEGVNEVLPPWVHMSVPQEARGKGPADVPVGQEAFSSVLRLLGVLPFDVHHLTVERFVERGFDEESWSWLQRR